MGVTPIYHFDYTKFPFKFKAADTILRSQHDTANHPQISSHSGSFLNSPHGSMTAAYDSFTMHKTREKTLINNRLSGATNKQYRFHGSLF